MGQRQGLQPSHGSTDDAAVHPAVAALPLAQKGLVLGALLARMPPDAFAARFPGAAGGPGQAALESLTTAPRAARASTLAELIALVRAAVPAGIERVHPGWLRERLVPESSAVIRAIQGAPGDRDALPPEVIRVAQEILTELGEAPRGVAISAAGATELRRRVFAGLVPLAEPGAPTSPEAAPLMTLSFAVLSEAIEARGAETLGVSLRGAPPPTIARAAAGLGGRLARTLLDAAAQTGPLDTREAARRLVARVAAEKPVDLAAHLGARALAVALAAEDGNGTEAALAVAQRLPPALGRRLLAFAAEAQTHQPGPRTSTPPQRR
jgi:hypothetical protein